jgi:hypothetical protein
MAITEGSRVAEGRERVAQMNADQAAERQKAREQRQKELREERNTEAVRTQREETGNQIDLSA